MNSKNLNDRRLFYFADPASIKIATGNNESVMDAYEGVDVSMDYAEMTNNYLKGDYSLLNSRYLKDVSSEPRMVISYAEQQLTKGGTYISGWITTGSAEDEHINQQKLPVAFK